MNFRISPLFVHNFKSVSWPPHCSKICMHYLIWSLGLGGVGITCLFLRSGNWGINSPIIHNTSFLHFRAKLLVPRWMMAALKLVTLALRSPWLYPGWLQPWCAGSVCRGNLLSLAEHPSQQMAAVLESEVSVHQNMSDQPALHGCVRSWNPGPHRSHGLSSRARISHPEEPWARAA
jgi:hypothetical protein